MGKTITRVKREFRITTRKTVLFFLSALLVVALIPSFAFADQPEQQGSVSQADLLVQTGADADNDVGGTGPSGTGLSGTELSGESTAPDGTIEAPGDASGTEADGFEGDGLDDATEAGDLEMLGLEEEPEAAATPTNQTELVAAITAAADGVPTTITLANNIALTSTLTIPTQKHITLNGSFTLTGASSVATITVTAGAKLTIAGITVTHVAGNNGNGVRVDAGGELVLASGLITGNRVASTGGGGTNSVGGAGVYNYGSFTMSGGSITGNTISGGYIPYGGAGVYNHTGCTFTMTGGEISGNTGSQNGGGVYNNGTFNMQSFGGSNPTISNNTAMLTGGGVQNGQTSSSGYNYAGSFSMLGGTISGNRTTESSGAGGGGIYNANGTITMGTAAGAKPLITGNSSGSGGGGVRNSGGAFNLISGSIAHNAAGNNSNGGGVYNSNTLNIYGGEISQNTVSATSSTTYGGGIYNYNGRINMYGGSISGNTVTYTNTSGSSYGHGGAGVYSTAYNGSSSFVMSGGVIANNSVSSSNNAGRGGGINLFATFGIGLVSTNSFTMTGGVISGNSASYGGGIYNTAAAISISEADPSNPTVISGNRATYSGGGGIYNVSASASGATYYGTVSMSGGRISGNTATSGGGIYNTSRTDNAISISGGEISNNIATTGNGGGIWVTNSRSDLGCVTVSAGVVFAGNRAAAAYNRNPGDDVTYREQIGNAGAGVSWTEPLRQGYNNYDISYVWASAQIPEFLVSYHGNGAAGGNAPTDPNSYLAGHEVALMGPENLAKPGYTFGGWARDEVATTPDFAYTGTAFDTAVFSIDANTDLYAVWEVEPAVTPGTTEEGDDSNAATPGTTEDGDGSPSGSAPGAPAETPADDSGATLLPADVGEEALSGAAAAPQVEFSAAAQAQGMPVANILGTLIPFTALDGYASWSLLDLIATVLCGLFLVVVLIRAALIKRNEDQVDAGEARRSEGEVEGEDKARRYRKFPVMIVSLVAAVTAVSLFVLTQDMSMTVVLFDSWSAAFAIILAASTAALVSCVVKQPARESEAANTSA